jgi:hypothetical protein
MLWTGNIAALAVVLFGILQLWPQEQIPKSKIVSDLSAEVAGAQDEVRDRAQRELFADYAPYEAPDIAT